MKDDWLGRAISHAEGSSGAEEGGEGSRSAVFGRDPFTDIFFESLGARALPTSETEFLHRLREAKDTRVEFHQILTGYVQRKNELPIWMEDAFTTLVERSPVTRTLVEDAATVLSTMLPKVRQRSFLGLPVTLPVTPEEWRDELLRREAARTVATPALKALNRVWSRRRERFDAWLEDYGILVQEAPEHEKPEGLRNLPQETVLNVLADTFTHLPEIFYTDMGRFLNEIQYGYSLSHEILKNISYGGVNYGSGTLIVADSLVETTRHEFMHVIQHGALGTANYDSPEMRKKLIGLDTMSEQFIDKSMLNPADVAKNYSEWSDAISSTMMTPGPSTHPDAEHLIHAVNTEYLQAWNALIDPETRRTRNGYQQPFPIPTRPYGYSQAAEFMTTATESYFATPEDLLAKNPGMFTILDDLFNAYGSERDVNKMTQPGAIP